MADLPGVATPSSEKSSTGDEAAADARAQRGHDHVVVTSRDAEPGFSEHSAIRVIGKRHVSVELRLERRLERSTCRAAEVGRSQQDAVGSHHPRQPDADRRRSRPGLTLEELGDDLGDRLVKSSAEVSRRCRRCRSLDPIDDGSLSEDDAEDLRATDVDADGRRRHRRDSARALSSRRAVAWIRPWARDFTNPGIGTLSCASR